METYYHKKNKSLGLLLKRPIGSNKKTSSVYCGYCEKEFARKDNAIRHIKQIHYDLLPNTTTHEDTGEDTSDEDTNDISVAKLDEDTVDTPPENIIITKIDENAENERKEAEELQKQQQIEAEELQKQQQIEAERIEAEELQKQQQIEAEELQKQQQIEAQRIMLETQLEAERIMLQKRLKIEAEELQKQQQIEAELQKQQQIEAKRIEAELQKQQQIEAEKQRTKNVVETNLKGKLEKFKTEMEIEKNEINKQKVELQNELNELTANLKTEFNDKEEALTGNVIKINQMINDYGIQYTYDELNDDDFDYELLTDRQYAFLRAINTLKNGNEKSIKQKYDNEISNIKKRITEIISDNANMNILKGELTDVTQSTIFDNGEKMAIIQERILYFHQLKNKLEREKHGIKSRAKSYRNIKQTKNKKNKTEKCKKIPLNFYQ